MNNHEPYPTESDVDQWDGPSLFVTVASQAQDRSNRKGFASLNSTERILCCLLNFDGYVNNGGFGMWLDSAWLEVPAVIDALREIGATEMTALVETIVADLDAPERFTSLDDWQDYVSSLPDPYLDQLEWQSVPFVKAEPTFLEAVYAYARAHWQEVRIM